MPARRPPVCGLLSGIKGDHVSVQLCDPAACAGYIRTVAGIAIALATISIVVALWLRSSTRRQDATADSRGRKRLYSYVLLGLWVLLPPVWFFFEFEFLHPAIQSAQDGNATFELSRVSHAQDLASKIWLALVVSLAAILNIKWPPQS
jgi:hypothetical protein